MGILQHHDAITGTASRHCYEDYMARLDHSLEHLHQLNSDMIGDYMLRFYGIEIADVEYTDNTVPLLQKEDHFFYTRNYYTKKV